MQDLAYARALIIIRSGLRISETGVDCQAAVARQPLGKLR